VQALILVIAISKAVHCLANRVRAQPAHFSLPKACRFLAGTSAAGGKYFLTP
jgi:hypothetical protein